MKTLYIECNMGAAGDMLCAAFADLFYDKKALENEINSIGLPNTKIIFEKRLNGGISGIYCKVVCNGETETPESKNSFHNTSKNISSVISVINSLNLNEKVKSDAVNIYGIIAQAEGKVHGTEISEVHFHELGMMDAIADVVICSFLIDKIAPDKIISSPVNVGNGTVNCAHGVLPVPAPATAEILKGVPFYKSSYDTELCTPTGAAILKYFTNEFTSVPKICYRNIGIGVGSKELDSPNILRAFLSETDETDSITELVCNIDDMSGEELSFACEKLFDAGALDVFTSPVFMKKNRPASVLTVVCQISDREGIVNCIFNNTSTIGIREHICSRYILSRSIKEVQTPYGDILVKYSNGYGTEKVKIEFESIKKVAVENNMSFSDAKKMLYNYLIN